MEMVTRHLRHLHHLVVMEVTWLGATQPLLVTSLSRGVLPGDREIPGRILLLRDGSESWSGSGNSARGSVDGKLRLLLLDLLLLHDQMLGERRLAGEHLLLSAFHVSQPLREA